MFKIPDLMDDNFPEEPIQPIAEVKITPSQNEAYTSYLLVNALFNLLVTKGLIKSSEITPLLAELHLSYSVRKKLQ